MKPEEFSEELKPSTREIIVAGPARPPEANLDYAPFPNIIEIVQNL